MDPSQIAHNVRAVLVQQERSGTWLARQIHMSSSTYSRRMAHPQDFTVVELDAIARALKVPISRLTGGNGAAA